MTALVWFGEFCNRQTRDQTHDGTIRKRSGACSGGTAQRLLRRKPLRSFIQYGLGGFVTNSCFCRFTVTQARIRQVEVLASLGQLILLLLASKFINHGLDFVVVDF